VLTEYQANILIKQGFSKHFVWSSHEWEWFWSSESFEAWIFQFVSWL